jgi:hypothetical protein
MCASMWGKKVGNMGECICVYVYIYISMNS